MIASVPRASPVADAARDIATRFEVLGPDAFSEDGRPVAVPAGSGLAAHLAERIYVRCHLRRPAAGIPAPDPAVDERLRAALCARLAGGRYADAGWVLLMRDAGGARVRKHGLTLTVGAREMRPPSARTTGELVHVLLPTHRPRALPGWFVYVSRHGQPDPVNGLWRVYGDVRPAHAVDTASAVCARLEAGGVRFQLKLLDASALGTRPDGLVCFLPAAEADRAVAALRELRGRGWLGDGTPGFAVRVHPGIALAPEPCDDGPARSFGQSCAEVAARATIDAWRRGADDGSARARLIAVQLERHIGACLEAGGSREPWT